ncbi:PaaI family thioesterase [uncultured Megasphaera sp.]|uniref:PaaI family thioesterase n=1 Tax=uncultured Megasphaera sp. TaxID=165188 RepID=UPI00265A35DF|nr:PaaI family thioesterase [uncultured Megasphaera sp.]
MLTDRRRSDEALRRRLRNIQQGIFSRTPYFRNLPSEIEDIDEGWVRLGFDISPHLCNYRGIASGGVLAAFCDTLMGMASRTLGYKVTTLEINMNYIRRVPSGCRITGIGQVVHHGGKTIVAECECFDEDGGIVVKGRSSFYVLGRLD